MREWLIISGRRIQGRKTPKHRSTHISNYQSNERESYEHDRERFALYKSLSRLVLCYKKNWATLLHLIYFCYLFLITNYLITKLSVTTYFNTCREYLAGNHLIISFCSSLGSTLLLIGRTMIDPLHLWVMKTLFWHRFRGVKRLW